MYHYRYVGTHHTMVVLEEEQPKVRVEPQELVITDLELPKHLFTLEDPQVSQDTLKKETKKQKNK